ncbi:uncharacterized protein BDV17DRAFT_262595 [Aspergillus undulatus]|uniref:uncharacterized protein n=1 Tax=Aspergillus undulatus TaxID=1810928 RepID=UPI003CCDBA42
MGSRLLWTKLRGMRIAASHFDRRRSADYSASMAIRESTPGRMESLSRVLRSSDLLRTHYNPDDDVRVKEWKTISEEYADTANWSIPDDSDIFSFGSDWELIFDVLHELIGPGNPCPRELDFDWKHLDCLHGNLKAEIIEVKRKHPEWKKDPNVLIKYNDCAKEMLFSICLDRILIADQETFETNRWLMIYYDAKQSNVSQCWVDIDGDELTMIVIVQGRGRPTEAALEEGSLGEAYLLGERSQALYKWTKEDLENDPPAEDEANST